MINEVLQVWPELYRFPLLALTVHGAIEDTSPRALAYALLSDLSQPEAELPALIRRFIEEREFSSAESALGIPGLDDADIEQLSELLEAERSRTELELEVRARMLAARSRRLALEEGAFVLPVAPSTSHRVLDDHLSRLERKLERDAAARKDELRHLANQRAADEVNQLALELIDRRELALANDVLVHGIDRALDHPAAETPPPTWPWNVPLGEMLGWLAGDLAPPDFAAAIVSNMPPLAKQFWSGLRGLQTQHRQTDVEALAAVVAKLVAPSGEQTPRLVASEDAWVYDLEFELTPWPSWLGPERGRSQLWIVCDRPPARAPNSGLILTIVESGPGSRGQLRERIATVPILIPREILRLLHDHKHDPHGFLRVAASSMPRAANLPLAQHLPVAEPALYQQLAWVLELCGVTRDAGLVIDVLRWAVGSQRTLIVEVLGRALSEAEHEQGVELASEVLRAARSSAVLQDAANRSVEAEDGVRSALSAIGLAVETNSSLDECIELVCADHTESARARAMVEELRFQQWLELDDGVPRPCAEGLRVALVNFGR